MFLCLPVTMLPQSQENNSGQKLSEVAHDATLTGKGTNVSPLSIANGAVSSTKLDTVNAPQAGQVLSFNGSGLSWQTPGITSGGGAFRAVDSIGSEVGVIVSTNGISSNAVRYISSLDTWIQFSVFKLGVGDPDPKGNPSQLFALYFEETNCEGQSFMTVGQSLFVNVRVIGSNAYFPSGPGELRNIKSIGSLINGACTLFSGDGVPLDDIAPTKTIPVASFGTPPFKIAR